MPVFRCYRARDTPPFGLLGNRGLSPMVSPGSGFIGEKFFLLS